MILPFVIALLFSVGCTDVATEPPGAEPYDLSGNWDVRYAMGDTTLKGHMYIREEEGGMLSGAQWTGSPLFRILNGQRFERTFWLHTACASPPGDTLFWDVTGRLSFSGQDFDGKLWISRDAGFERSGGLRMYGTRGADSIANVVLGKSLQ